MDRWELPAVLPDRPGVGSEILAERWTPLIIHNLMSGADTFSALARGLPAMSRSMLIKRLGELERAGILAREPKPDGRGHLYGLTVAGADLADVIQSLGQWGERWVEVTTEHFRPVDLVPGTDKPPRSPEERTVVSFTFLEEAPTNRYYWLLVDRGDAGLCYSDPGDEPDLFVVAESLAFVNWHRGKLRWSDAVQDGQIQVTGKRPLARSLPNWNLHSPQIQAT